MQTWELEAVRIFLLRDEPGDQWQFVCWQKTTVRKERRKLGMVESQEQCGRGWGSQQCGSVQVIRTVLACSYANGTIVSHLPPFNDVRCLWNIPYNNFQIPPKFCLPVFNLPVLVFLNNPFTVPMKIWEKWASGGRRGGWTWDVAVGIWVVDDRRVCSPVFLHLFEWEEHPKTWKNDIPNLPWLFSLRHASFSHRSCPSHVPRLVLLPHPNGERSSQLWSRDGELIVPLIWRRRKLYYRQLTEVDDDARLGIKTVVIGP